MLPLKELEFRDLLLYMKSDKIKVYKIGGSARFIKVQGVITLYYNYSHSLMKFVKVGVMNQKLDLWSFKEFINFYYTKVNCNTHLPTSFVGRNHPPHTIFSYPKCTEKRIFY